MKTVRFVLILIFCLSFPVFVAGDAGDPVIENKQITGSLVFDVGATVDEFSTDGTLGGNSDTAVPTEQAVKTYVDNVAAGVSFAVAAVLGTL